MTAPSDGFGFSPVFEADVILAVWHFKNQKKGEDGVAIVAKALPVIAHFLNRLFNTSLTNGVFTPAWKKAWIIALKKAPVPPSTSDFRPIALLCFLAKVLEKLEYDQVVDFLAKENIMDPAGFRKHHNIQIALLKLTDDIHVVKGSKLATLLLQFDFSKAFD